MRRLTLIVVCCLATSGCVRLPAQSMRANATDRSSQCFWPSQVSGFSDAGPDKVRVRAGFKDMWELEVSPGCPDANWAMKIAIVSRGGGPVCPGRPAELIMPSASGQSTERCLVRNVRKLSAEETARALGPAHKR